jgi:hypothetical protein
MPSCSSNSSNLSGNVNITNITNSGARLLMTIPLSGFSGGRISGPIEDTDGVTAGDAIRYDAVVSSVSEGKYIKAQADSPANSEVVGIVEEVTPVNPVDPQSGIATIVISGQINYPESKLVTATHIDEDAGVTGSAGGNDIYFLSAATAGVLQNLAPVSPTQVIKPIYQVAPDSPWSGQVVNYIGYQSGGQIVAEQTDITPPGTFMMFPRYGGQRNSPEVGWKLFGSKFNLSATNGDKTYLGLYDIVGNICKVTTKCYINKAPTSSNVGTFVNVRKDNKKVLVDGKIVGFNIADKVITVEWKSSNFDNIEKYLTEGRILNLSSGSLYTLSSFERMNFELPKVDSTTQLNSITFNIDNKPTNFSVEYYIYAPEDLVKGIKGGFASNAVTIPQDLTMSKVKVTDTIEIENSTISITNLASAIETIQNSIDSIGNQVHGTSQTDTDNVHVKNK